MDTTSSHGYPLPPVPRSEGCGEDALQTDSCIELALLGYSQSESKDGLKATKLELLVYRTLIVVRARVGVRIRLRVKVG